MPTEPPVFQPTLEMITDKSFPSKQEIKIIYKLIYKLYEDTQACRTIRLQGSAQVSPTISSVFVESYAAGDKLWVELANGKLSYGDFNSARKDLAARHSVTINQAAQQLQTKLENQHQTELLIEAQRINAINANRPVTTNCNTYGSSVNCTSY